MRLAFSSIGILLAVALVGLLAKRQLAVLPAIGSPSAASAPAVFSGQVRRSELVQPASKQLTENLEQFKSSLDVAQQPARVLPDEAK